MTKPLSVKVREGVAGGPDEAKVPVGIMLERAGG
jgi:hypothetical protein